MRTHTLSMACIGGLLFMDMVLGCKEDSDPVSPQERGTYVEVVFGTFRGIWALVSLDSSAGFGEVSIDTTSYIHIERSDQSYSIKLRGTCFHAVNLNVSFEEAGQIQVKYVAYHPADGYRPAHWEGNIIFTPDSALYRSPWALYFYVGNQYMTDMKLSVYYPQSSSISLGQDKGKLRLCGWRTKYPYFDYE